MKTAPDPELIVHLNAVLKSKLTGINQYFLHARMLKHQGDVALADNEYRASIEAMKHSDMLVEHVLALGGFPNLQELGSLMIGETSDTMLASDLAHGDTLLAQLKAAIAYSESAQHLASAQILKKILDSHNERAEFIRTQLNNPYAKDCA